VHIGQPEISARVAIGQFLVIDAHQVENRGVVVVNVTGIRNDVNSVLIRLAISRAAFDASTREQTGECPGVMIATLVVGRRTSLVTVRAA
jgi:hypothetical protein